MRKQTLIKLILTLVILLNKIHSYAQSTSYQMLYNDGTFTKSINTGLQVGVVDGQQGTTQTGAATYTIPIKVTPGINGMEPKLAITYSSQNGNGLLGVGWNLSGLSSITLDNRNIYYDGKTAPINIAPTVSSDGTAFSLDGMRLIGRSGTYGWAGSTYSTELENYSLITAQGVANASCGCPLNFNIKTKDGLSMDYGDNGSNPDALILSYGNSYPIMWRLKRTTDNNGNYIDYKYSITTDGESKIDEINYTGNSTNNVATPFAKVKFIYSERSDPNIMYVVGSNSTNATTLKSKWLLDKIIITSDAQTVKTYKFNYAFDGIYSVLQEVKEIGSDNTELNSTILRYGNPKELDAANSNVVSTTTNNISTTNSDNFTGDFDGDGYTDILTAYYTSPTLRQYTSIKIFRKIPNTNNFQDIYTYNLPSTINISGTNYPAFRYINVADYDGDGKSDIMFDNYYSASIPNSSAYVFISGKYSNTALMSTCTNSSYGFSVNEYNNLTNLGVFGSCSASIYGATESASTTVRSQFINGDFDGDGATDIITTLFNVGVNAPSQGNRTFITRINTNEFYSPIKLNSTGSYSDLGDLCATYKPVAVADFDGDGKDEILLENGMILFFRKNSSNQWECGTIMSPISSTDKVYCGDFNGDGKTDILRGSKYAWGFNDWKVFYSKGYGFDSLSMSMQSMAFDQTLDYKNMKIIIGDFNGDGKADIIQQVIPMIQVSQTYSAPANYSNLHICYSNGVNFTYRDITINNSNTNLYIPKIFGDFDGDGATDIICRSDISHTINSKPYMFESFGNQQKERYLRKIIDGFNRKTEFTYSPLTIGLPFYNNGNGPTSYYLTTNSLKIPIYAVSNVITPDGIGGNITTSYTYTDVVMGKYRKGFFGFSKINSLNSLTNINTEILYENNVNVTNNTITSLIPVSIKATLNGNVISQNTYSYAYTFLGNKRFKTELSNSTSIDNVNGKTLNSNYVYDGNGNVINQTINNTGIEVFTINRPVADFVISGTGTVPSLPKTIIESTTRGSTTFSKTTKLNYDSKGRIISKIDFDGTTNKLTTTFGYDNFGNIITTSSSGFTTGVGIATITKNTPFSFDGRYLQSSEIQNVKGVENIDAYDNKWQTPTSITNASTYRHTQITYDAFGRTVNLKPTMPGGPTTYDINTKYDWSTLPNSIYMVTQTPYGMSETRQYYDMFNRLVREEKTVNGKTKFTQNTYDAKGDIINIKTNDADGGTIETINTYDLYHRLLTSSPTIGAASANTYTVSSNGYTVSSSTTGYPLKISKIDATGKTTEVTETAGTNSVTNIYSYHANGRLLKVTQSGKDLVVCEYDANGNQTKLTDIDAGSTLYEYDAFRNITKQTDGKNNITESTYDLSARPSTKSVTDGANPGNYQTVDLYSYYPANSSGEGLVKQIQHFNYAESGANIIQNYEYDEYDRLKKETKNFEGTNFVTQYEYGDYGRLKSVTYPSATGINPVKISYTTTADGYVTNVSALNAGVSKTILNTSTANNYNAFDQLKSYSLGNGLSSQTDYNKLGMPTRYLTNSVFLFIPYRLQDLQMPIWDLNNGNLMKRIDASNNNRPTTTEVFTYDGFNRLTSSTVGTTTLGVGYDAIGNITNKFDAGTEYLYNSPKIHAVENIKSKIYDYPLPIYPQYPSNNAPNERSDISGDKQQIIYNGINQPSLIIEGGGVGSNLIKKLKYIYDIDGNRIKSIYTEENSLGVIDASKTINRYYLGNYEFEKDANNNITRQLNYISTPVGLTSILDKESGQADAYFFTYTDHLGSVVTVTDQNAVPVVYQSFDAWGRPRSTYDWSYNNISAPPAALNVGFTGHEMLSKFDLINMNGRLYDPKVGRMLASDNYVHDAFNTQHFNRYSYVWNNPLKYIDINGEDGDGFSLQDSSCKCNFLG